MSMCRGLVGTSEHREVRQNIYQGQAAASLDQTLLHLRKQTFTSHGITTGGHITMYTSVPYLQPGPCIQDEYTKKSFTQNKISEAYRYSPDT